MLTVRLLRNGQLTLPTKIRNTLYLEEGDLLEAEVKNNHIVLIPSKIIPKDQSWFHTYEWQQKEKEADEAIAKNEVDGPFDNIQDALAVLKANK